MHNFSVDKVTSFNVLAKSENTIQMISHKNINAFGVSFHPEVRNQEIITNVDLNFEERSGSKTSPASLNASNASESSTAA